jgi:hypothetical protein
VDIGKLEACFDRGEKFMRHVEQDWKSKYKDRYPGREVVGSIGQTTMVETPPLQIADVVAWGRNRLTAGSHWESDPYYLTAVGACIYQGVVGRRRHEVHEVTRSEMLTFLFAM